MGKAKKRLKKVALFLDRILNVTQDVAGNTPLGKAAALIDFLNPYDVDLKKQAIKKTIEDDEFLADALKQAREEGKKLAVGFLLEKSDAIKDKAHDLFVLPAHADLEPERLQTIESNLEGIFDEYFDEGQEELLELLFDKKQDDDVE